MFTIFSMKQFTFYYLKKLTINNIFSLMTLWYIVLIIIECSLEIEQLDFCIFVPKFQNH